MTRRKLMAIVVAIALVILAGVVLLWMANRDGTLDYSGYDQITVSSPSFSEGVIPVEFTGKGEDKSPALVLKGLTDKAVTIAVVMDDLDHPMSGYNHWVIWNLPPMEVLPEGVPHGETVAELGGAVQGIGYGSHRYRGPLPPFGVHRYTFHVFVLDTQLELDASARKKDLLAAMEGHILQYGSVTGSFPEGKAE